MCCVQTHIQQLQQKWEFCQKVCLTSLAIPEEVDHFCMVDSEMIKWVCGWSLRISNIDKGQVTETHSFIVF
jgi:hypothetical protein